MGYSTSFNGSFSISPEPTAKLLRAFNKDEYYDWHISDVDELEPPGEGKHYDKDEMLLATLKTITEMGFKVNGEVTWQGEEGSDFGKYVVNDGVLKIYDGVQTFTLRKPKVKK